MTKINAQQAFTFQKLQSLRFLKLFSVFNERPTFNYPNIFFLRVSRSFATRRFSAI